MKRVSFKDPRLDDSFENDMAEDANDSSEEDQEDMSVADENTSEESNSESEAEESKTEDEATKLKKPTDFQFVPLKNAREFDSLWARVTSNRKKETVDKMLEIIRKPDDSRDKIFEEYEGEKTITFKLKDKKAKSRAERQREHIEERQRVRRSAGKIIRKLKPLPRTIQKQPF